MEDSAIDPSQESAPIDAPVSQTETSPEPPVVVTGGRRRGRRKVMKKKTIKDEEGYLGSLYAAISPQRTGILTNTSRSHERRASVGILF